MPNRRTPLPDGDIGNWGNLLNDYLRQISDVNAGNTAGNFRGGLNNWVTANRPTEIYSYTKSGGTGSENLGTDHEGLTGINTTTGQIERWSGSAWVSLTYPNLVNSNGNLSITATTTSTSSTTGALVVAGGVGIGGTLNVEGATGINGGLTVGGKITTATFRMTTGATNGYVLTSDASGNATWGSSSMPSGTTSQTFRYSGTAWVGSSNLMNSSTGVALGGNNFHTNSVLSINGGTAGGYPQEFGGLTIHTHSRSVWGFRGATDVENDGFLRLINASSVNGNMKTGTISMVVNGSGDFTINSTTASTSTTTGALTVGGGVGIAGALNLGTALSVSNGGTGANNATSARTNLDVPQNSNVIQLSPRSGNNIFDANNASYSYFGSYQWLDGSVTNLNLPGSTASGSFLQLNPLLGTSLTDKYRIQQVFNHNTNKAYQRTENNGIFSGWQEFAFLENAQTFSGTKTFSAITTISNTTASTNTTTGALIVSGGVGISEKLYVGGGYLALANGTSNLLAFANNAISVPTFTTRSVGTKILLWNSLATNATDFAIGIESNSMWLSVPVSNTTNSFKWYGGTTNIATLDGTGNLTIASKMVASTLQVTTGGSAGKVLTSDASGNASWQVATGGSATPAGANSQIQFNNSGVFGANANLVWDNTNGRLGIGVASPSANLSVVATGSSEMAGTVRSTALLVSAGSLSSTINSEIALASFGFTSVNATYLGIRALRTAAGSTWQTTAIGIGMDTDNLVRAGATIWLNSNGNVGIGTSAPAVKLDVNGSINAQGLKIITEGYTTGQGLKIIWNSTNSAIVGSQATTGRSYFINHQGTGIGGFVFSNTVNDTTFSELMRIDSNGNVGIGTGTPTARLNVLAETAGTENIVDFSHYGDSVNAPVLRFRKARGTLAAPTAVQSGDQLGSVNFTGYNGTALTGVRSGITGIARENFTSTANGAGLYFTSTPNGSITPLQRMIIDQNGNVGIGTSSPREKLEVAGAIMTSGSATTGGASTAYFDWWSTGARIASYGANTSTRGTFSLALYASDGTLGLNVLQVSNAGNIGIGTTAPGYKLEVATTGSVNWIARFSNNSGLNGNAGGIIITAGSNSTNFGAFLIGFTRPDGIYIGAISQNTASSVSYNTTSDIRLKENIVATSFVLTDLMKLKIVDYNYIGDSSAQTGLIAQEVYEIIPSVVNVGDEDVKTRPWGIDYGKLTPFIIKATQEQQTIIENLKSENQILWQNNQLLLNRNLELKSELEILKAEMKVEITKIKQFINFPN